MTEHIEETKRKIEVMQAFVDGKDCEIMVRESRKWSPVDPNIPIHWNWLEYDYRIKPEPREWWLNLSFGTPCGMYNTHTRAIDESKTLVGGAETIKVREVIEDE